MGKFALVLIVVVVGVVLFFLFTGDGNDGDYDPMADDDHDVDETERALLEGSGRGGRNGGPTSTNGSGNTTPVKKKPTVWFQGVVVDAQTGRGVPGALLLVELHREPCPRFAAPSSGFDKPVRPIARAKATDANGAFEVLGPKEFADGEYDLFVTADGYVTTVVCLPGREELTITLARALQMKGRVTDPHSRPIEGATIKGGPAQDLPLVPGSVGEAVSDREGRFVIDGLAKAAVVLEVDHPHYMPSKTGPLVPGSNVEHEIQLAPAFRASFEIRTADGEDIANTTLQWGVPGDPESSRVQLLTGAYTGPPARPKSEMKSEVVRIPVSYERVDLEIKADGYAPWRATGEPLPADGGERVYQVELARDATVGSLRIKLVDEEGAEINYMEMQGVPSVMWLGQGVMRQAFVIQGGEDLYFPALPAGPYRIGVRSAAYGPGIVETKVVPRQKTEVEMKLGPPAKVRVRFTARERVVVQFRFLFEGRVVHAFPEKAIEAPEGMDADAESLHADSEGGLLVTGLGAGRHVLEVTSPNLVPLTRVVDLTPGETAELEIEVQLR